MDSAPKSNEHTLLAALILVVGAIGFFITITYLNNSAFVIGGTPFGTRNNSDGSTALTDGGGSGGGSSTPGGGNGPPSAPPIATSTVVTCAEKSREYSMESNPTTLKPGETEAQACSRSESITGDLESRTLGWCRSFLSKEFKCPTSTDAACNQGPFEGRGEASSTCVNAGPGKVKWVAKATCNSYCRKRVVSIGPTQQ